MTELAEDFTERLLLDHTKIAWHLDRVKAWERGERIAPITIDMSLNQSCQAKCSFCYMQVQKQTRYEKITVPIALQFIEDCAEIGVKGVSLVSDGESTLSKAYVPMIQRGAELGVSMASGTNAERLDRETLEKVMPHLTYLRVNFSGGTRERYCEIMGVEPGFYDRVCGNIRTMMEIKRRDSLPVTVGTQMVLMPQDADQILPFARLSVEMGVDYGIVKHTSDSELGELGVDYSKYEAIYPLLREAESLSTDQTKIIVKWNKIKAGNKRSYRQCLGPPFILQLSGSGLAAPCGQLFNERYREEWHIGNICETRLRDIVKSDRYWDVISRLRSPGFNPQTDCGSLCLAHLTNVALDNHQRGLEILQQPAGPAPAHVNFI